MEKSKEFSHISNKKIKKLYSNSNVTITIIKSISIAEKFDEKIGSRNEQKRVFFCHENWFGRLRWSRLNEVNRWLDWKTILIRPEFNTSDRFERGKNAPIGWLSISKWFECEPNGHDKVIANEVFRWVSGDRLSVFWDVTWYECRTCWRLNASK